ncbi:porin family protein [Pollutibacter soli]|uniref:porin family protein n=1 Tax=Pollutibacter soli TaxID=3034157 RepID=UPI0030131F3E
MKKFNLLLTAAMAFFCNLHAQKTNVGLFAGPVFAKTNMKVIDEKSDFTFLPGIYTGVFLDMPVGKKLTVQSGVNYVQKGFMEKFDDAKVTMRLHYLEIPVNLVWYSALQQKGFYVGAGPSFSFGVAGRAKYKDGGEEYSEKVNFGEDDDMKGADIAGNVTTGYTFENGISLGAVANFGLINLGTSADTKIHNNYFALKVGYVFRQKSK